MSKELPIFKAPVVVESTKREGVAQSISEVCGPKCDARHCKCGRAVPSGAWTCECGERSAPTPESVLAALETRALLLATEKACEELGARLSGQIRSFGPEELLAYAEATQGRGEG